MAPLWLPLVTALIAALSALSGVLLSSHLAKKDRKLELMFRAKQEARDFLLSRGEDLYVHLDRMDNYVSEHCRLIQLFCNRRLSFEEFRTIREERMADLQKFSTSKVKLYIKSFFPSIVPLFDDLVNNITHLNIIDSALMDSKDPKGDLLYRISADASRLQKHVTKRGKSCDPSWRPCSPRHSNPAPPDLREAGGWGDSDPRRA